LFAKFIVSDKNLRNWLLFIFLVQTDTGNGLSDVVR